MGSEARDDRRAALAGRGAPVVVAAIVLLVVAAQAGASPGDHYRVLLTPSAQAAAKAASIFRSDLSMHRNWRGGFQPSNPNDVTTWKGYHPKHSDITLNGEARTIFQVKGSAVITTITQVLATPAEVRLDDQRSQEPTPARQPLASGRAGASASELASQSLRATRRVAAGTAHDPVRQALRRDLDRRLPVMRGSAARFGGSARALRIGRAPRWDRCPFIWSPTTPTARPLPTTRSAPERPSAR
jgi:hypothetical protein